jgi:hypothetical protein
VASALRAPKSLAEATKTFEEVGVDELVLCPTLSDLDQVDRLADAVL